MTLNNTNARVKRALLTGLTLAAGSLYQSCGGGFGVPDLYNYTLGSYDIPWDYGTSYGPIDQGAFDNAAAAWDDDIRM